MQTLQYNYDSFEKACDGVIKILKDNQQEQFKIIANFEGRSFKVITKRVSLIDSSYLDKKEEDLINKHNLGVFGRQLNIKATNNDDLNPLAQKFCVSFGTARVKIYMKNTKEK